MASGVIFDMDGLLFDTERYGLEASEKAGAEQGIFLSREIILRTLGMTDEQTVRIYQTEFPYFDTIRFKRCLYTLMRKDIEENGMPIKPYAKECVLACRKAGAATALASSNSLDSVKFYLEKAGMESNFDVLVSGDSSLRSKPAPDIFLRASELLGINPAKCTVFEDSPNGLRAARAAGMRVYIIPDLIPYEDSLSQYCDGVLKNLGEAISLVPELICL